MSERDFDLAEKRSTEERDAGIDAARRAIGRVGRAMCECGASISETRRRMFGAIRCLDCQRDFETETKRR